MLNIIKALLFIMVHNGGKIFFSALDQLILNSPLEFSIRLPDDHLGNSVNIMQGHKEF